MTYAIYKISWNPIQGQQAVGGICGTAFFVEQYKAITAHHVLNSATFKTPNPGFLRCRYWLLGRDGRIIDCSSATVTDLPEIDLSVIRFNASNLNAVVLSLSAEPVFAGVPVRSQGYNEGHGNVKLRWNNHDIYIECFDLSHSFSDGSGTVTSGHTANISCQDLKLDGVIVLKLSYGGSTGMSGGPLLIQATSKVIGMMSFGLPPDVSKKDELYAVSAREILKRI